jgi:hypothetical protein
MEQTTNTTEKILTAIESQRVTPRPEWYFTVRNTLLWTPGIITTLLGAYTVAGILYGVLHAHPNPLFLIAIIPLLWVISFMLFSLISSSLLRKTHTGYRHTTLQLLLISVACSIIIGILFYAVTQDADDNRMKTYYRYPTEHQDDFIERNYPALRMN